MPLRRGRELHVRRSYDIRLATEQLETITCGMPRGAMRRVPTRIPWSTVLLLVLFSQTACSERNQVTGTWDLSSIGGVPVADAPPERFEVPAGSYGSTQVRPGDIWTETRTISGTLEVLENGEYLQTLVRSRTRVTSPSFFARVTGQPPLGEAPLRGPSETDTARSTGPWRRYAGGDSIVFEQTREQVMAALKSEVQSLMPDLSDEEREEFLRVVEGTEIPPRAQGSIAGDRLLLLDLSRRRVVYRRRD